MNTHATNHNELLAKLFEEQRPRLRAVAYRMLGSLAESDDAVQETWLRLSGTNADDVTNLSGWLTTVTARICLNVLRSRRTRGEQPLDGFIPEPIISAQSGVDPEHEALLADAVGIATIIPVLVNGAAGLAAFQDGRPFSVLAFTVANGRAVAIDVFADEALIDTLDLHAIAAR
jgi:hypothetical protein